MRISLGKPIGQEHDSHTGHLLEATVNTFHPRPALLALLLLILLLLLPRPVMSAPSVNLFEQRCESEMRPRFEVLARLNGFAVHNTVSSRVLNTRATYAVAGQAMMGMTASSTRAEIGIDGVALTGQGRGAAARGRQPRRDRAPVAPVPGRDRQRDGQQFLAHAAAPAALQVQ
jgi:hypothetical protein